MVKYVCYIGMGSNVPEAAAILEAARQGLAALCDDEVRFSSPVATEPIDFPWPARFINQVARLTTAMKPKALKASLKRLEREAGRQRGDKQRGVVRLDLDLLAVDGEILRPADWQRSYIQQGVAEL